MIFIIKKLVVISQVIYNAFLNEIALERYFKNKIFVSDLFLDFKVLQLSNFFSKPSFIYFFSIYTFLIFIFLLQLFFSFFFLIVALFLFFIPILSPKNLLIRTSDPNLLDDAMNQLKLCPQDFVDCNIWNLLIRVNKYSLFNYTLFYFIYTFLVFKNGKQVTLFLLNSKDLFLLYLLTVYINQNSDKLILSDNHYQRDGYIVSILNGRNYVVAQHGFLDCSIPFPCNFGSIRTLFVSDYKYLRQFELYFKIKYCFLLEKSKLKIFKKRDLSNTCFLASSSPFIDFEIQFSKYLKKNYDVFLIIKKHPKHLYQKNKINELLTFADEEWSQKTYYPNSKMFISYSSYLEKDYSLYGSNTFNLSAYSNVEDLFNDSVFIGSLLEITNVT